MRRMYSSKRIPGVCRFRKRTRPPLAFLERAHAVRRHGRELPARSCRARFGQRHLELAFEDEERIDVRAVEVRSIGVRLQLEREQHQLLARDEDFGTPSGSSGSSPAGIARILHDLCRAACALGVLLLDGASLPEELAVRARRSSDTARSR